jgi:hypothetical protein
VSSTAGALSPSCSIPTHILSVPEVVVFFKYTKHPFAPGTNADSIVLPSIIVVLAPVPIVNISDSTVSTVNESVTDNDRAKLSGPGSVVALAAFDVSCKVGFIVAMFFLF